jgi:UDP-glucuronate decarboxylase
MKHLTSWLVSGSTGFVGQSLLSSIPYSLRKSILISGVSSQNRNITECNFNEIGLTWDVTGVCPLTPSYSIIIHAATPASALLNATQPEKMFELNVLAMKNIIEFAGRHDVPPIVLFTSSGAVYGDMPQGLERIPEGWKREFGSQPLTSAYARGKIEAEAMLQEATEAGKCVGLIARLFAFSGVHLPIDKHFAIGNFVRDVVQSQLITIRSDGSSVRSYMDGHDLAMWLLRIVEAGSPDEIYHIGSERAISIRDLASLVAARYELLTNHSARVEILGTSSPLDGVSRYVPSTYRTRQLLGLDETITLEASIDQMILHTINTGL